MKRLVCLFIFAAIFLSSFFFTAYANPDTGIYSAKLSQEIMISDKNKEKAEFEFELEAGGSFNIFIKYKANISNDRDILVELKINNTLPFEEADFLLLERIYENSPKKFLTDEKGNELRPTQKQLDKEITSALKDTSGYHNGNYEFTLKEGKNLISIRCVSEELTVIGLELIPVKALAGYSEYIADLPKKSAVGDPVIIEGEKADYKSSMTLYPTSDKNHHNVSPSHPYLVRLNTIGQNTFKMPGQWIEWNFETKNEGLYDINIKFRQNINRGLVSQRKIYIDGEVPFKELENVKFPYSVKWQKMTADESCPVYLKKGPHSIKIEVIAGDTAAVLGSVEQCVLDLNQIYRSVISITGLKPDPYRDYSIEKEIPALLKELSVVKAELEKQIETFKKDIGTEGSEISLVETVVRQLGDFIKDPEEIPLRLEDFKNNITSLGSWLLSLSQQPLEIDYIAFSPSDTKLSENKNSVFGQIMFDIKAFIASFTSDYSSISKKDGSTVIKVWQNSGRDQAQVVKALIDDSLMKEHDISVDLNLVGEPDTIIQATLAGKGPDVALLVTKELPVNLAVRGAVENLADYSGFEKIKERFYTSAFVPYTFEGKTCAVPTTQSYNMMFYRKDIFNGLEIKPPDTWDDFFKILPIIQRSGMQVGIAESQTIFETLLLQENLNFYKDDLKSTNLNSSKALTAFQKWTQLYTKYSLPMSFDFYNRFRTGEMPMGIVPYNTYNLLSVAAPELRGLWEMYPVPATVNDDGSLNRRESALGTASILLSKSKHKQAGFDFIEWWSSDEIQARYGRELEQLMGPAARFETANKNVLSMLNWTSSEIENLSAQWKEVWDVEQLPSSYYTSRNISNMFRAVVLNGKNERESLNKYNKLINSEILRKRKEFNLE